MYSTSFDLANGQRVFKKYRTLSTWGIIVEIGVLTEEQKYQWKKDGYLVLKGVLSAEEIEKLTTAVDQMDEEHRKQLSSPDSQNKSDVKSYAGLNRLNIIEDSDIFIELIDHPATFPVVLELLGSEGCSAISGNGSPDLTSIPPQIRKK